MINRKGIFVLYLIVVFNQIYSNIFNYYLNKINIFYKEL